MSSADLAANPIQAFQNIVHVTGRRPDVREAWSKPLTIVDHGCPHATIRGGMVERGVPT
jgi:hypothetical protein